MGKGKWVRIAALIFSPASVPAERDQLWLKTRPAATQTLPETAREVLDRPFSPV